MPLLVQLGHCTRTGARVRNEDFVGMVSPSGSSCAHKGCLSAIADGVSGNEGGREAAEYSVRGLLADYYATPDTWEPITALEKVLQALNRWVLAHGQQRGALGGMATTLSTLLLRGRCYYFAHVGDTRIYLLRGGKLTCLTCDHVWDRPDMSHVLTRGIGLDTHLTPDYGSGALECGDRFLLVSDGVWSALAGESLQRLLASDSDPEVTARALCEAALAAGSQDNASAIVAQVQQIAEDDWQDVLTVGADLLPPPLLKPGQELDGLRVEELLQRSATSIVYRVTELASARVLVLKSLNPERGADPLARSQFLHESWLAKRVVARFFAQVIDLSPERRSALYYLQTWHAGMTLASALDAGRHFSVPELLQLAIALARALGALHRRSILHRDVKPENLHLGADGATRLLDFGIAVSALSVKPDLAGTPSYLAPELFRGAPASPQTDLYGAGVTLYQALTRQYPYGEIEAFQRPRFGEPVPPARYRPDLPTWLENVLLKAVAREPSERFETAEEFLLALERGAARPLPTPPLTPLLQRSAGEHWRVAALISLTLNALLLYLLLALSAR